MSDLFRPEAVAHVRQRLAGEVVLATPLSFRLIGLALAGVLFGALVFAAWATYARTASVTGWLVPDLGFIRATAPAGGQIVALLVGEGDEVTAGQQLAEIKIASAIAGGDAGDAIALGLRREAEALKARGEARVAKLEAEATQAQTRIKNLKPELTLVEQQEKLQESRIGLARKAATELEGVASRGVVSQREVEQRRSTALAAEQELAAERRQAAALEREIADLDARIEAIPIEITVTRADTASAEAALNQRAIEAEQRRAVAPMAGRVAALPVANNQPIAAGATLAVITPLGGKLEAELLTPSRAIGFVAPGQEVELQLQAFPYQRFGTLHGAIKSMSSTVLGPSEIAIPGLEIHEPVFRVRVTLAHDTIDAYGKSYSLQPGMLLSADIVFDRRTLLQWLFDPLYAARKHS
jgi:membrane fusion protein